MTDLEYAIGQRVDSAWHALKALADYVDGVARYDVSKAAWRLICQLEEIELEQE